MQPALETTAANLGTTIPNLDPWGNLRLGDLFIALKLQLGKSTLNPETSKEVIGEMLDGKRFPNAFPGLLS